MPLSLDQFRMRGVITALVTPYDEQGHLAEAIYEKLIEFQIRARVHGLSPCGTTGETALLSYEERRRLAEIAVRTVRGRVPIFVQCGAPTTEDTIALTRHARDIGADAATVVTPYFFSYDDKALVAHYVRVAESVPDFPIFLYNIPQRTGNNLTPAIVHAIAERCPNVLGMKDSSGNLTQIIDSAGARGGKFQVAIGSDSLILSALVAGIPATVSGNANVCPELFVELFEAYWHGDLVGAQAAQAKIQIVRRALHDGADLSLFKSVLAYRGIPAGGVRPPLLNTPPPEVDAALQTLRECGIPLTPG